MKTVRYITLSDSFKSSVPFWYNTITKEFVNLDHDYHTKDVAVLPHKYGYTKEEIGVHEHNSLYDKDVAKKLFVKHWVKGRIHEHYLSIQGGSLDDIKRGIIAVIRLYPLKGVYIDVGHEDPVNKDPITIMGIEAVEKFKKSGIFPIKAKLAIIARILL